MLCAYACSLGLVPLWTMHLFCCLGSCCILHCRVNKLYTICCYCGLAMAVVSSISLVKRRDAVGLSVEA